MQKDKLKKLFQEWWPLIATVAVLLLMQGYIMFLSPAGTNWQIRMTVVCTLGTIGQVILGSREEDQEKKKTSIVVGLLFGLISPLIVWCVPL